MRDKRNCFYFCFFFLRFLSAFVFFTQSTPSHRNIDDAKNSPSPLCACASAVFSHPFVIYSCPGFARSYAFFFFFFVFFLFWRVRLDSKQRLRLLQIFLPMYERFVLASALAHPTVWLFNIAPYRKKRELWLLSRLVMNAFIIRSNGCCL